MNRADIIRMALECGWSKEYLEIGDERLERFAALVIKSLKPSLQIEFEKMFMEGASAERERLAKVFDELDKGIGFYDPHEPAEIIRGQA